MNQQIWDTLTQEQRNMERDESDLTQQFVGLEGKRVEVIRMDGTKARFYVGRSTGWKPIHIEVLRINSMGGGAADREYKSVRIVPGKQR